MGLSDYVSGVFKHCVRALIGSCAFCMGKKGSGKDTHMSAKASKTTHTLPLRNTVSNGWQLFTYTTLTKSLGYLAFG